MKTLIIFLSLTITSMSVVAETPAQAIKNLLKTTSQQNELGYELFSLTRNKTYLSSCFTIANPYEYWKKGTKSVQIEKEFINTVGVLEKIRYYADGQCQNPFEQKIKTNPFKVHQRAGNKFLIEILGDPFTGTLGEIDIYEITPNSIDTAAQKVDINLSAEALVNMKLEGNSYKLIRDLNGINE